MSKLAASSSSGLEAVASWLDNWHHFLFQVGGASILYTVCGEPVISDPLPTVAGCGMVTIMVASDTLPVRSSRGCISIPWGHATRLCHSLPQMLGTYGLPVLALPVPA